MGKHSPYAPWCWYIYQQMPQKSPSFVGKYILYMEHMGREKKQKKNIKFDGESDLPMISWWADGPSWRFLMFSAAGSVDLLFKHV